jgi:predicted short-subunit dehydrogenase-like oxidoreductase (DUF2520 family)
MTAFFNNLATMLKVAVIGSGNVAHHLVSVFEKSGQVDLVQAYARNKANLSNLLPAEKITDSLESLKPADVYIISVTDDAIAEVASQLPFEGRLVVHTSGSVAMQQPDSKNHRGVFYLLQTFSKNKEVDFSNIPICIESERPEDYGLLAALARTLSGNVYKINSQQRQSLHVAAVFVSNFSNRMYAIGNAICDAHAIPFDILKPLIQETAHKILTLPPVQAQTGPAVRNDTKTIERHLDFLQDDDQKKIYTLLTQSIQKAHVNKL